MDKSKLRKIYILVFTFAACGSYLIWEFWVHRSAFYEGEGFNIEYPNSWGITEFEKNDLEKSGTVLVLAPKDTIGEQGHIVVNDLESFVFLTVSLLYIEFLPKNVKSYKEWHELQFEDTEYKIHSITTDKINSRDVTRVLYYKNDDSCGRTISDAVYFNDYLSSPANNRLVVANLTTTACAKKSFISEGLGILENITVTKLEW
jgi:hypothetical protein